MNRTGSVHI